MNKVDLSAYNNDHFRPGSIWKRAIWLVLSAVIFESSIFPFTGLKAGLLRAFGAKIGRGVVVKIKVSIKYPWFLEIGDHSWIGEGVWIDNLTLVSIGKNVCLSQGAMLLTGNHDYSSATFDLREAPITIEEGAWIGAKAIVCPGITVKSHAVLAVGSVATTHLDAYTVYAGNPAVAKRQRTIG